MQIKRVARYVTCGGKIEEKGDPIPGVFHDFFIGTKNSS